MDKKIIEYRKKYKKCKWCKYYKWNSKYVGMDYYGWGSCELKDKYITWDNILRLCKYYALKEEEQENDE